MLRRVIIITPALTLAAVGVTKAAETPSAVKEANDVSHLKRRPSELPLYAPLHSSNNSKTDEEQQSNARRALESGVRVVRTEIQSGYNVVADQMKVFDHYYETAKAHSMSAIDYLNQPHNSLPRSGAIAIGGLAGFIFAARGGFIRKVLYTTTGAGVIASICYPRQAEVAARESLYEARKVYAIAYNFVKGVKPGDEISVDPVNKFPTSLEEVKFLFWDLYDEVKEVVWKKK
ncbi:MICOS complex subunit MIC27 [Teleopsis dalmanni]|uniref:MICOS complex subunit MIC27 n=1 Tax=Teleopsis dalmanni TaxID=139649 RepID=UPI0018CF6110|nr:MICOS complex subunit MIC27 [Teleopsis dalmanni]